MRGVWRRLVSWTTRTERRRAATLAQAAAHQRAEYEAAKGRIVGLANRGRWTDDTQIIPTTTLGQQRRYRSVTR